MKSILVATDGSKNSNRALAEARELAECKGSDVTIIHVTRNSPLLYSEALSKEQVARVQESVMEEKKESMLLLDEALKIFQGFPRKVNIINKSGDAGDEIIKEAEKGDYDLIVMGSRGLGIFSRILLGSISNKVLNHVSKNVLIIK